ncbi:MAG TPA: hypothetical protein DCM86_05695 [Verrucomicrobiales bacterium]|nr:hypothetical protein [Verrucomicrobiales bacterium]
MQIQLAVLCDAATDYNGKLNLLGTFDTLITSQLPAIHPQCAIALRLTFNKAEEGRHILKINFTDEDGRPILTPQLELMLEALMPDDSIFLSRNAVVVLQNLKLDRAGLYSVEITVDGKQGTNIPLLVKYMPQPQAGGH